MPGEKGKHKRSHIAGFHEMPRKDKYIGTKHRLVVAQAMGKG